MRYSISLRVLLCILACSLLACRLTEPVPPLPTDAPTPTALSGVPTFAPIVTITHSGAETEVAATATPDDCKGADAPIDYNLNALLDVDLHTANGTLTTTYRNMTDQPQKMIIFNVEPNRKPGVFTLTRLDSTSAVGVERYTLTGPRLEVDLKQPLEVGCKASFTIGFSVLAPVIEQNFVANTGYFGFTARQFNLSKWLPEVAPYIDGQWITPESWPLGEITASLMGNYTATVKVRSKNDKMQLIAPGEVTQSDDKTWQVKFDNSRSFSLAVTAEQEKLTTTTTNGVTLELYYFPSNSQVTVVPTGATPDTRPQQAAKHALETARIAVERFSSMFGEFPYKRLIVLEGDFPDGMEFSGLVYVGAQWFTQFDGKEDSWLTLITAHEVSHQWWYSEVGNRQADEPFLDEGLALYSEYIYIQTEHPSLAQWWWQFRVKLYSPQGKVDSRVYDFQNLRSYLDAAYLRGALMLQEIREAIGDEAFFKWLRDYRAANAGKIASMRDFWQAMIPADYAKIAPIRTKYLKVADPLNPPTPTAAATQSVDGAATDPCCG